MRRWSRSPAASRSSIPEIDEIARQLIARKKFVYLCTNALLMEKKLELFEPSPYFAWAVHLDGLRERHDASVEREGVFDKAVSAIRAAKEQGFRVTTNTTFFTHDSPDTVRPGPRLHQRRARGRPDDDLAGLRLREGPGPGPLPRRQGDARAVQRRLRRRPAEEVAPQPHTALPRLPRGQGRLPVHGLGHPELRRLRLAAALLPDGRRLRQDLQGARRDDGLGEVRSRPRPALRQLHGALRIRADRRPRATKSFKQSVRAALSQ